jgi:hypothetical protein
LIVALAAGCSFDASRLQGAVSRAADGASEYPVVPDRAVLQRRRDLLFVGD